MEEITYRDVGDHMQEKSVHLPQGNLYTICNVLSDYADLIAITAEKKEDGFEKYYLQEEAKKYKKIQSTIEEAIGYSVEDAIKKCERRKKRQSHSDIGGDALDLAVAVDIRTEKRLEEERAEKRKKNGNDGQLELDLGV